MIEIRLDQGDMQRVIQRMTKYNNNVRQGCQREIGHSSLSIQRMARENLRASGAIATGRLRSSVNIRFTSDRLGALIGTNVNYAGDVEYGQKPGHWPNVGDLVRWVRKKITANLKASRRIAYLVGRKIFQRGTEAKPYLFPAAEKIWPVFKNNIYRVLKMS